MNSLRNSLLKYFIGPCSQLQLKVVFPFGTVPNTSSLLESPPPKNLYNKFVRDNYAIVKQNNPNSTSGQIFKILSLQYQQIPEDDKELQRRELKAMRQKLNLDSDTSSRPPPTPRNVFNLFVQKNFSTAKFNNPDANLARIMKILGGMFQSLSQYEKELLANELSEKKSTNSQDKADERKLFRKKIKFCKSIGLPTKPPNSPIKLFIARELKNTKIDKNQIGSALSATAAKWKDLSDNDRQQHISEWENLQQTYLNDLQEWAETKNIKLSKNYKVLINRAHGKYQKIANKSSSPRGRKKKIDDVE